MKKITTQDNFIYLTFALILLLLGTSLAEQFFDDSAQRLVQSITITTLLVAVWGVDSKGLLYNQAVLFPISVAFFSMLGAWLDHSDFDKIYLLLFLSFLISTALRTAKQVLFTGEIDGNKILGAICLYLLLGLIWAVFFTLLQLYIPGSFSNIYDENFWFTLFPQFIYFSFVTMTTLGFGDIAPLLPTARFIVYLEAVIGQFYLAILVASLVGSHMTTHRTKKHK